MDGDIILMYNLAAILWIVVSFIDCWVIVNSVKGNLTLNSLMDKFTLRRLYPNAFRFIVSERLLTFIIPMGLIATCTQLPLPTLALVTGIACTLVNLRFCMLYLWTDKSK